MNDHTQIILIVTIFYSADYIYSRHLVCTSISGETYHSSFQYIFFSSCISLSLKTASFPPKHTHNRAVVFRTWIIVQGVTYLEFASQIGFDRKVSCLTYFYLTRFPTAKCDFQTRFETRSRYSHTPPEIEVIVNREKRNNVLRIIYVGCLLESQYYHQPISWCRKKQKLFSPKGFVKVSAIFSAVSMDLMMIVPWLTNRLKWWYLMAMCFVRGVNCGLF